MAKNGLELGPRVEIFSKKYRVLNDLLLNEKEVLDTCKFIKNEGAQFVNVNLETGEGDYDGVEVLVYSEGQEDLIFLKVTEQSEEEINALNLGYQEAIDFDTLLIAYHGMRKADRNQVEPNKHRFVFVVDKLKKVSGQVKPQEQKQEHKQEHKG
ncbi:putative cytoplasmic protein [Streptococcus pneumoniae]|nr:putative cytoplasmic protein [Streptococcus pneumoniae]CAG5161747.1 putative cytoplasmic protein [Streptococcus pneumoniae]